MKQCYTCKQEKPEDRFYWRDKTKTKLKGQCKDCEREQTRARKAAWYIARADKQKAEARVRNTARRIEFRAVVNKIKEETPCADCGRTDPYYLMDFDHLANKEHDISRMSHMSMERVLREMAKCEVVCCRCHRIRTYERQMRACSVSGQHDSLPNCKGQFESDHAL